MATSAYVVERASRKVTWRFGGWFNEWFRVLERLSRRKLLTCLLVGAFPIAIRLAALPMIPFPYPHEHDEFSYLLAADTFASGRLTNPPHPMWVHFETFHENFQPTYMSKYPPAQGLFLALGQKVFGHPGYGVLLSFGLMCTCLCWMLQGWAPPVYALLGTLVGMSQIGIFGYWMNSYWGGAVAAAGGCLLLGSLPRLITGSHALTGIAGSLGVVILANSRPYEGLALTAAVAAVLIWWICRTRRLLDLLTARRVVIPFLAVSSTAAIAMGYYNYRVTGKPFLLPYTVNDRTYAPVRPLYLIPPAQPAPTYRHEMIRKLWMEWYAPYYYRTRKNPLRLFFGMLGFTEISRFYCSSLLAFAFAIGALLTRGRKLRVALLILLAFCCALWLEILLEPHYAAPALGVLFIPAIYGLRLLRLKAGNLGPALLILFVGVSFAAGTFEGIRQVREQAPAPRQTIERSLMSHGGRHLVIVRYAPTHNVHDEFVFNRANIDASPIVWARDMGDSGNTELIMYYKSRQAWLLTPDTSPMSLTPYSSRLAR